MNWRRALIAGAVAIPVLFFFAWGLTRDPGEIPSPLPGRAAPDFALEVFAPGEPPLARAVGDTVRASALKGRIVVLNFWASWCLACRDEHTILSQGARAYADQPVTFLGVLYNDEPRKGNAWIAEMGGQSYPSVNDPGARTAIEYGLYGVPETFFVNAEGRVVRKHTGPIPAAVLKGILDSLLAAPRAATTP
ncbi:MAG: redoxin domain-containing protein [Gemmatimonadaceae bacterium]|nr:redoxin domain-containing protein [Gemmatimonadaceae bacterium]